MSKLDLGQAAPDFALPSTSGSPTALRDLRGKKVVLYFYPKDDTPGCTREACSFRDNFARVRQSGATVLGVSGDSLLSHAKFRGKYALPFELLCDADHAVAQAYGAWGEKTLYGKKLIGTIRSTFVIDGNGRVAARWSPVKVDGHVEQVLAALQGPSKVPEPNGANAPKKPSTKNRTFAQPARSKAGKAAGRVAAARASAHGRGYRQASRVKGHTSKRGSVK